MLYLGHVFCTHLFDWISMVADCIVQQEASAALLCWCFTDCLLAYDVVFS
jgi:hypothetical protein